LAVAEGLRRRARCQSAALHVTMRIGPLAIGCHDRPPQIVMSRRPFAVDVAFD
jgi:hypothetical protein